MAQEKARIEAELVGGQQVAAEAQKIEGALGKVGTAAAGKLTGGLRAVGGALGNIVQGGLQAAGVFQTISLANAVEDARRLDLQTAKLGQSVGVAGSVLKSSFDAMEKRTLTSAVNMADFSRSLGRATYDSKFAAESVAALSEDALAVGRDLGDELPLAVALRDMGVQSSGLVGELGRLRDMAESVGTVGGPVALRDSIAALSPLLSGVATNSDEARTKLEALVAVLGKGLKPQQAQAVAGAALQTIRSRALQIEQNTGVRVLDDKNQITDPAKILAALKKQADQRFGRNEAAKRRALINDFGGDLGLAVLRYNPAEVDQLAASATDRGKTAKEAEAFRQSKEGQRLATTLQKDQALRGAGEKLLGIHDTLVDKLGVGGALATELGGGQLALTGAKAAGKALLAGGKGAALGTAGTVAGVTASFAAPALAVLSDIGEKTEVTGARYLNQHAAIQGEGLARRAIREGDLTGAYMAAGGDKDIQAATLAALEKLLAATTEGNELLRSQVAAGIAAEIKKTPLTIKPTVDPNAPRGNNY